MQIILIRHGKAEHQTTTDANRSLTAEGESQAQQTAAWLVNHGYQLDALFVSPYVRAQQTAVHLSQSLDVPITTSELIKPDSELLATVKWLEQLDLPEDAVIALVCHMPIVGRLASFLIDGDVNQGQAFHLAQAKVIELSVLAAGLGQQVADFIPHA